MVDRPKALALVGGRPFLDILVQDLQQAGFARFVLCVGHGADMIVEHYRGRRDAEFLFSVESAPLGTGGAVTNALPVAQGDPLLVLNGDSFCDVPYADLLAFHQRKAAALTIVAAPEVSRDDAGTMVIGEGGRLAGFAEKPAQGSTGSRYINAGIYVISRAVLDAYRGRGAFSLERDLFPAVVGARDCFAFPVAGPVVDIGTPERLGAAAALIGRP